MKIIKTAKYKKVSIRSEEEVITELLDIWKGNYLQMKKIFQYASSPEIEEENKARAKAFGEGWLDPDYDESYELSVQEYFENSDNSALDNAAREIGMSYKELNQIVIKRVDW